MPTFTDKNDKEWTIEFDGPTLERIASPNDGIGEMVRVPDDEAPPCETCGRQPMAEQWVGLDLAAEDGTGFVKACSTGQMIVRVCWYLCEEQAKEANIDPVAFGKAMAKGEVIEGAEKALRQALVDFIRPNRRSALIAVLDSQQELESKRDELIVQEASNPTTKARLMDAVMARMQEHIARMEKFAGPSGLSASDSPATPDAAPEG